MINKLSKRVRANNRTLFEENFIDLPPMFFYETYIYMLDNNMNRLSDVRQHDLELFCLHVYTTIYMKRGWELLMNVQTGTRKSNEQRKRKTKLSVWTDFFKRLRKNKAALIGGILILLFIIIAVIGPFFTPFTYEEQNLV